jgi:hypothetical protein
MEEKKKRNPSNIARRNKAIGRDFQKEIRDMLLLHFPTLELDDIRSNPMGAGGEDLLLSPKARAILGNTQHECKSREKIAMSSWIEQSESHGRHQAVVWFKETGKGNPIYATITASFLIHLLKQLGSRETLI